jgi:hypothetical protein
MNKETLNKDQNITRRDFLKKLTMTTVFTVPTITSTKLLAQRRMPWTAHGHGHHNPPPPPPSMY